MKGEYILQTHSYMFFNSIYGKETRHIFTNDYSPLKSFEKKIEKSANIK